MSRQSIDCAATIAGPNMDRMAATFIFGDVRGVSKARQGSSSGRLLRVCLSEIPDSGKDADVIAWLKRMSWAPDSSESGAAKADVLGVARLSFENM